MSCAVPLAAVDRKRRRRPSIEELELANHTTSNSKRAKCSDIAEVKCLS